jgi:hypothetical protein
MSWTGLIWHGPAKSSCEHGNEPLGSIKWWEVLKYLSDWRLLKKGIGWFASVCQYRDKTASMAGWSMHMRQLVQSELAEQVTTSKKTSPHCHDLTWVSGLFWQIPIKHRFQCAIIEVRDLCTFLPADFIMWPTYNHRYQFCFYVWGTFKFISVQGQMVREADMPSCTKWLREYWHHYSIYWEIFCTWNFLWHIKINFVMSGLSLKVLKRHLGPTITPVY